MALPPHHLSAQHPPFAYARTSLRFACRFRVHARTFRAASSLQDVIGDIGGKICAPISLTDAAPGRGRSVVAEEEVAAGTRLISLPIEAVLSATESPELPLPWSVDMALTILELRASAGHQGWLSCLPTPSQLSLPITSFSEAEVAACGDEAAIHEARAVRGMLDSAAEALEGELSELEATRDDFMWAASLAHSRCFVTQGSQPGVTEFTIVPGIDMCNHSFQPTASVRIRHSPDTCQGADATAEVCEPPPASEGTCWELVAGDAGIRQGEEVTISYGNHPDEFFYLFYGFLPEGGPGRTLHVFNTTAQLNDSLAALGLPPLPQDIPFRLGANHVGFEPAAESFLMQALQPAHSPATLKGGATHVSAAEPEMNAGLAGMAAGLKPAEKLWDLLRHRCLELLDEGQILDATEAGDEQPGNRQLSVLYREQRRQVLHELIARCKQQGRC